MSNNLVKENILSKESGGLKGDSGVAQLDAELEWGETHGQQTDCINSKLVILSISHDCGSFDVLCEVWRSIKEKENVL